MEKKLTIVTQDAGERLDRFLQKNLEGISRTRIHKLISEGSVTVNDLQKKPSYRIKENQIILVNNKETGDFVLAPFEYTVPVIYEDDEVIVIEKPLGISVHPAHDAQRDTIVNALVFMGKVLSTINPYRAGIVHRLDKETSGVMVIAKSNFSHLNLVAQFRDRLVKKEYHAIVWGKLTRDRLTVDLPMKRDEHNRLKMKISFIDSKRARTDIEVIRKLSDSTLLLLRPFTGRMHQIRVHLKFLGYPIVGDKKYGLKDQYETMFLHAHKIGFFHPKSAKFLEFTSAMPQRFEQFLRERGAP